MSKVSFFFLRKTVPLPLYIILQCKKNFSSESSADEEEITDAQMVKETEEKRIEKAEQRREELRKQKEKREKRKRRIEKGLDTSSEEEEGENMDQKSDGDDENTLKSDSKTLKEDKENLIENPKKAKRDIWKKITIGDVYEAALTRYLVRKAERGSLPPPWVVA